jgi:hypothetical protein
MKKLISLMTLLVVVSGYIIAQERYDDTDMRGHLQVGVKVGTNYSNVYDIKGQDFSADFKFGFVSGLWLSIPVGKQLGIRPEVLYSQKGYQSTGNILGAGYKITHTADYIDVPLLLEIKPIDFITVVGGPEYSYLVHTNNEFSNTFLTAQQEQTFDNINLRKNLLSFLAGLDFNFHHLVIGTRFGFDLIRNNGDGTSTNPRYRNLWYQATLGLRF